MPRSSGERQDASVKTPASEAQVRVRLDSLFRQHGFRIVNDYPCDSHCIPSSQTDSFAVTLDGYDPQMHVGYEYLAPDEMGLDVSPKEQGVMEKSPGIFVATPASLVSILANAEAFLQVWDKTQSTRSP